ncbi:MAG: sigma-54-dependent Fis family transcriptional regulator [Candidatus Methylomirabilis oxyfera]|nr:sigma-54-dependent Fis family transcriptional regulator [Candidatus Methylomirabilis oxyfera]
MTPSTIRVLVADDETNFRKLLVRELERRGYQAWAAEDGVKALEILQQREVDVVLLDLKMPSVGGIDVMRRLKEHPEPPEVIVMTGYASIPTAIEAVKLGAYDYVTKPCKIEKLDLLIRKAFEKRRLVGENLLLRSRLESAGEASELITESPKMLDVLKLINRAAPTDSSVLILGESGTGKDLLARAIHDRSPRKDGPFVAIHCGGLQREILESELFGHERGAFTGAHATKPGLFEMADKGTVLLDEIGEMPLDSQVKLLRALETQSFYRVGGTQPRRVDVRIVAATNKDLAEAVRQGLFRQDLFYRINTVTITLPPLRERPEDVLLLVEHFLADRPSLSPMRLSKDAAEAMTHYSWPGNVRELKHVIQRALMLAPGELIELHDLPLDLQARSKQGESEPQRLDTQERRHIVEVLQQVRGHRGKAAAILGIDPKTLYRKVLTYQIRPEEYVT